MSDNLLDPNILPNDFYQKPKALFGVKRLSKKPLIIAVIVLIVVIFSSMFLIGKKESPNDQAMANDKIKNVQAKTDAGEQINSLVNDLSAKTQVPVLNSAPKAPVAIEVNETVLNPTAPVVQQTESTTANATQSYEQKRLGAKYLALGAPTQIKIQSLQTSNESPAIQTQAASSKQADGNEKLLGAKDNYELGAKKEALKSAYTLQTGSVIPGVMITGINSELPGQITAQVSENVYDSPSGKYLLIPQGAKLLGVYSANVVYGQSRVLVAWNRLTFPDGKTINLGAMTGADFAGYSGSQDQVDNHYARIFGSALLMSAITAGVSVSGNSYNATNNQTQTPSDQMISAMVLQLGMVGNEMIRKNLNIAPTIMIRPGYKLNVFVTKDILLEPIRL